jgi:N-acetylmuramoyl-L-alanine amidase
LRPGARGNGVAWLQGSLADLGLLARPTSGRFDAGTIAAVRALQQASGLVVDGTVGPRTKIRLYQLSDRYRVPRLSGRP